MTFQPIDGAVCIVGSGRPVRLSPAAVDTLLDLFEREGATDLMFELLDVQGKLDGVIPL